jgi:pimeloyl-ACP methyl ester carboxylesterase
MKMPAGLLPLFLCASIAGCSLSLPHEPDAQALDTGRLPVADVAVNIPQLGPCTDAPDRTLRFNSGQPVAVLVHGCKGSAGRFRSLAQLYAFHGQQAVCFSYDDRESLVRSSGQLIAAVDALAGHLHDPDVTVIGHSMGGLVARKSMEGERRGEWRRGDVNVNLVTISAPVAGIAVASPCGYRVLHWLSLGTVPATCWAVTGDNWYEITSASQFISRPGPLLPAVRRYVKVVTDERDTCRRRSASGTCLESDFVFSLPEQYHPVIDGYQQLVNVQVDAGHVEIVGYRDVAPRKLLAILQQQGVLAPTPPERRSALERLLAELY